MATNSEIIEWVAASEVKEALLYLPDSADIHAGVVRDRVDLVRTAIGSASLDIINRATADIELAQSILGSLGFSSIASLRQGSEVNEAPEEGVISLADFGLVHKPAGAGRMYWGLLRKVKAGEIPGLIVHSGDVEAHESTPRLVSENLPSTIHWMISNNHVGTAIAIENILDRRRVEQEQTS